MKPQSSNTVWHHATVTRVRREQLNGHKSAVLWFTGLSGAGKSTIAHATEECLHQHGYRTYVLDGDNVRHGLCGDLSFSIEDRHENIRRIGEMAKLFADAGIITLTAFISPLRADRERVRHLVGADFIEVYCRCPVEVCEERDVKGLYRKARAGEIRDFTGVSSPYEEPVSPELIIDSNRMAVEGSVATVIDCLKGRGVIRTPPPPFSERVGVLHNERDPLSQTKSK
jgi:adenylylsulfate kinase